MSELSRREPEGIRSTAVLAGVLCLLLAGCGGRATSGGEGSGASGGSDRSNDGSSATTGGGTGGDEFGNVITVAGDGSGGSSSSRGSGDAISSTTGRGSGNPTGGAGIPDNSAIVGELDGEPVAFGDWDGSIRANATVGDGVWWTNISFEDASIYLWEEGDGAFGLVELRHEGPSAAEWICLAEINTDADDNAGPPTVWTASSLSRLPNCTLEGAGPLDLDLELAGEVVASLRGEPMDWELSGYGSSGSRAEFRFLEDGRDDLVLLLDLGDESSVLAEREVEASSLVVAGGYGAVACGGPGTFIEAEEHLEVHIERVGPFGMCPGEPVDGELRGDFAAP